MKLKLNKDGSAVVKDGKPVYVHSNGREEAFDAPAAWKLALGAHFEASPVMAGLKLPADVAASFFGDSFRIEGGKLVAVDNLGIQIYSPKRHGEAADFNEAFAHLVDRYEKKGMIQREGGAPGPGPGAAVAPGQQATGSIITRLQFDALPPVGRAQFLKDGGRVGDVAAGPAHAPAPVSVSASGKTMTRTQFDSTPPQQAAAFFKSGGKLVD